MFLLACYLLMMALARGTGLSFMDGDPVVNTSLGRIQGTIMESFEGNTIYTFLGIPYAEAPEGELRFAPPQTKGPWVENYTFMATENSIICPQGAPSIISKDLMGEDCLKLNVYTRNFDSKVPVIVYIHGGANIIGSGSSYEAGPEYLMDYELVFVTLNYRLGAFGFMTTGVNTSYTGNYGYLDQVLALEWIQQHISNFGGDPENVTIMGLSAGGMSISLHVASPLSAGLFHRGILLSGSATNHYSIDNVYWTRRLAKELACPMYNADDVVGCLRNISWEKIVDMCSEWEPYNFVNMKWNYAIDNKFMPEHPSLRIATGRFNRVPLLVSFTANEFDYSMYQHQNNNYLLHDFNENFVEYAPEFFTYDYDAKKSLRLKEFYLGNGTSNANSSEELLDVAKVGPIFSDAIIGHGVYRLVDIAREYTNVYYMRTDYVGKRSFNMFGGIGHGEDLQYILPSALYSAGVFPQDHPDVFMMKRMTQWYAEFAKTGALEWSTCNKTTFIVLYNNVTTEVGGLANKERYMLWDELFPKPRNGTSGAAARQLVSGLSFVVGLVSWKLM